MDIRRCITGFMAAFMMLSCICHAAAQPKIKGPLYMADRLMSTNRISQGGRMASVREAAAALAPLAPIPYFKVPDGIGHRNISADYAYLSDMIAGGRSVEVMPLLFADGLYGQSDTLSFLRGRTAWAARQFARAESDLSAVPATSPFASLASQYRESCLVCLEETKGSGRSPVLAAAMSAVIPGSGKMYAGNLREGVSALITVGALAGITAESISKNGLGDWRSIGLAAVSGLFYAANIYGSYLGVSTTETLIDNARKTAVLFTVGVPLAQSAGR